MARSNEPLVWAPFFAGAGISALLMPVTIVLTGLALALGWIDSARLYAIVNHPLGRLYLFVLISLSLFHAVHRIRFILIDLGLKGARDAIGAVCYGLAVVGTVVAGLLALHLI